MNDELTLRQCPTPIGDILPLIAHRIEPNLCLARQRDFYHKCHRCQFRGKPATFELEQPVEDATRNGKFSPT